MSDGQISVRVQKASNNRPADCMFRAEGGNVVMSAPPPGDCLIDPVTQVPEMHRALALVTATAMRQRRDAEDTKP